MLESYRVKNSRALIQARRQQATDRYKRAMVQLDAELLGLVAQCPHDNKVDGVQTINVPDARWVCEDCGASGSQSE